MLETKPANDLPDRIYKLVSSYVYLRTEKKSGISWDSFKAKKTTDPNTGKERLDIPDDYRGARESICTNAFLRVRACRSHQDFVDYFTGTLCSVPQFLPADEYQKVAGMLLNPEQWEEVKALTMLALSGLSRT